MPTRRNLLVAAGAVGAAATAGCTDALGDDSGPEADDGGSDDDPDPIDETETEPDDEANTDSVRLEDLSVQNNDDTEHRINLAVDADGEMLHLGTYDLEGGESTRVEGDWTDAAASYRVHARLNDGGIVTEDVTEGVGSSTDCVRVLVQVADDGDLAVWTGSNCRNA